MARRNLNLAAPLVRGIFGLLGGAMARSQQEEMAKQRSIRDAEAYRRERDDKLSMYDMEQQGKLAMEEAKWGREDQESTRKREESLRDTVQEQLKTVNPRIAGESAAGLFLPNRSNVAGDDMGVPNLEGEWDKASHQDWVKKYSSFLPTEPPEDPRFKLKRMDIKGRREAERRKGAAGNDDFRRRRKSQFLKEMQKRRADDQRAMVAADGAYAKMQSDWNKLRAAQQKSSPLISREEYMARIPQQGQISFEEWEEQIKRRGNTAARPQSGANMPILPAKQEALPVPPPDYTPKERDIYDEVIQGIDMSETTPEKAHAVAIKYVESQMAKMGVPENPALGGRKLGFGAVPKFLSGNLKNER